ncbi:hypothetical protein D3C85_1755620 [compost metagenome]
MQRFMALLQGPDGMFLGLVLDEALLFDGLLPGTEGRVDSHARQYAIAKHPKGKTDPVAPSPRT